jgi:hypothetical protein
MRTVAAPLCGLGVQPTASSPVLLHHDTRLLCPSTSTATHGSPCSIVVRLVTYAPIHGAPCSQKSSFANLH